MKRMIRTSKRKLLSQLVLGNFVIALIVITVMGILSVTTSKRYIETQFIANNKTQLEQTATYIDGYFDRIMKLPLSINAQNQNIKNLIFLAREQKLTDFANSFTDFIGLYADCDYIQSIWIYEGTDYIIDTKSGLRMVSNFNEWKTMSKLMEKAKGNYIYMIPYIVDNMEYDESMGYGDIISFVYPLKLSDSEYREGSVVINVNMSIIANKTYQKTNETGSFYIYNTSVNSSVVSIGKQDISESLIFSENQAGGTDNIRTENIKVARERFNVHSVRSVLIPDYTYVFSNSYDNVSEEMKSLIISFIVTLLLLIIIEMIVSVYISKYICQPINYIFSNINMLFKNENDVAVYNNENELDLINNYMLELHDDLSRKNQAIDSYMPIVQRNLCHMILEGEFESEEKIYEAMQINGVGFCAKKYIMCVFMIDDWLNIVENNADEQVKMIKNSTFTVINSEISKSFSCISDIPSKDRLVFIIDAESDKTDKQLDMVFSAINDLLMLQLSISVSMARTHEMTGLSDAGNYYKALTELSYERFKLGYRSNIRGVIETIYANEAHKIYLKRMAEMIKALSTHDEQKAAEITDIITESLRQMSIDNIKAFMHRFLYTLKSEYNNIHEIEYLQNNIMNIIRYSVADEWNIRIKNVLGQIIEIIPEEGGDNVAFKIKEYIDCNYQMDLSLVYLADLFKFSSAYLSTLFKNTHSVGVVDYINKVRINKAKYLLKNTDMSIKDISENVGFTNYNSFARVFKKVTGISAKDFKHNIKSSPNTEDEE